MSGVTNIEGVRRVQKILRRAARGRVKGGKVSAEFSRQNQTVAGLIPEDSGDTKKAMTRTRDKRRKVEVSGATVRIVINTRGAYWQRHQLPRLVNPRAMARVAVGTIFFGG